jgi:hypothetical protein
MAGAHTTARPYIAKAWPRFSGEVLDLVVDYLGYVLVPALAIATGAILPPPIPKDVGELSAEGEAKLAFKKLPKVQQIGYLSESGDVADENVDEVVAAPIFSTETGDVISTLVVGFQPFALAGVHSDAGMKSGIWLNGRLHLRALTKSAQANLDGEITNAVAKSDQAESNFAVSVNGAPHLLFYKRLNPGSLFPPAYEICIYPLADSMARLA